jgi:hypothetical protein
MFGVDVDEFCDAAESWICDAWGISGAVLENDPVRKWRSADRDYPLRSNRHGDEPTVEDLKMHLELHAMYCVAGEYVRDRWIRPRERDDEPDEWEAWLARWGVCEIHEGWLADQRQRTPLERCFWSESGLDVNEENLIPSDEEFDRVTALAESQRPEFMLVYSNVERQKFDTFEDWRVMSALVSHETARALLRALSESQTPMEYRIPWEGDDFAVDYDIDGVHFALKGFLNVPEGEASGLDRDDPFRNQLRPGAAGPGVWFQNSLALERSADGCEWNRAGHSEVSAELERWDDRQGHREHPPFETAGQRLWLRKNDVWETVERNGYVVITEALINRRIHRRAGEMKGDYERRAKLYLRWADGTVESARVGAGAGTTD